MPQARDIMLALRATLARIDPAAASRTTDLIPLGSASLDGALGGGLSRGALHEVYPGEDAAHGSAAAGFGLGISLRAGGDRPIVWIRQDSVSAKVGRPDGSGLAAFGADPNQLILVQVPDYAGGLMAAREALRCNGLGAVLVELWGASRAFDLAASRRLALAADRSRVTLVMVRLAASPSPSAAMTRWSADAAASSPLEANAPGRPAFAVTLLRHRAGIPGRRWHVEWDRDRASFSDPAPLPRALVSSPARREARAQSQEGRRRAG